MVPKPEAPSRPSLGQSRRHRGQQNIFGHVPTFWSNFQLHQKLTFCLEMFWLQMVQLRLAFSSILTHDHPWSNCIPIVPKIWQFAGTRGHPTPGVRTEQVFMALLEDHLQWCFLGTVSNSLTDISGTPWGTFGITSNLLRCFKTLSESVASTWCPNPLFDAPQRHLLPTGNGVSRSLSPSGGPQGDQFTMMAL